MRAIAITIYAESEASASEYTFTVESTLKVAGIDGHVSTVVWKSERAKKVHIAVANKVVNSIELSFKKRRTEAELHMHLCPLVSITSPLLTPLVSLAVGKPGSGYIFDVAAGPFIPMHTLTSIGEAYAFVERRLPSRETVFEILGKERLLGMIHKITAPILAAMAEKMIATSNPPDKSKLN